MKFQRHVDFAETVSPEMKSGETVELLFLAGSLFAGDRRFFLGGGVIGFGLFLAGLLAVGFRGFISHDVLAFFTAVDSPAE
ncbi:MAG TPA: hypothetical protein VHC44_06705 [Verrucomicrobiae bacterium]|nr:hypothetical protein [Verrucomicrobiae bacterium]